MCTTSYSFRCDPNQVHALCWRLCSFGTFIVDRRQTNRYSELRRRPPCTSTFSCRPTSQEVLGWPGRAGVCGRSGPLSYFTAPKGSWEQNVGDGPQQVVHAGGGEGGAEDHDDSWWQQVIMKKSYIRSRKTTKESAESLFLSEELFSGVVNTELVE